MQRIFKTGLIFTLLLILSFIVFSSVEAVCVGLDCPTDAASTVETGCGEGRFDCELPAGNTGVNDATPSWGAGAVHGAIAKVPWEEAAEECLPLLETLSSPEKAFRCVAVTGAAINMVSFEAIGKVVEGVESAVDEGLNIFDLSVTDIFGKIVVLISQIVGFIVAQEMYLMVFFMSPDTFQYATFPAVQAGFYVSLQIANGLLAIGLVILANKFILGMESYSNLQSLTRYLTAALLINFSLVMASYIIGVSNFLTIAFLNQATAPITGGTTENYATRLMATMNQLSEVFSGLVTDTGDLVQTTVANITTILVLIIFSMFLIMILAAIIISLLTRVIALWTLMMVVPLAIAADTVFSGMTIPGVPVGSGNFNKWLGDFIKWVSFGPIMAGVIWFVFLVLGQFDEAFSPAWANDPNVGIIMATLGKTFGLLTAMILFYQGYTFAHSSSSGVPKFVDGAVRNIFSYDKEAGLRFAGKTRFGAKVTDSAKSIWTGVKGRFGSQATKAKIAEDVLKEKKDAVSARASQLTSLYNFADSPEKQKTMLSSAVETYMNPKNDEAERNASLSFVLAQKGGKKLLSDAMAKKAASSGLQGDDFDKDLKSREFEAKQNGVSFDSGDVYKSNPLLKAKKNPDGSLNLENVSKYVSEKMSGEELGELSKEVLNDPNMDKVEIKNAARAVGMLKNAKSDEARKFAFDQINKHVDGSEEIHKQYANVVNHDGEAMSIIASMAGGGDVLAKVRKLTKRSYTRKSKPELDPQTEDRLNQQKRDEGGYTSADFTKKSS